jgi:hypothetical protein
VSTRPMPAKSAMRIGMWVLRVPPVLVFGGWWLFRAELSSISLAVKIPAALFLWLLLWGVVERWWRSWALRRGADPTKLHRLGVATGIYADDGPPTDRSDSQPKDAA